MTTLRSHLLLAIVIFCTFSIARADETCTGHGSVTSDSSTFYVSRREPARGQLVSIVDVELVGGDTWARDKISKNGVSLEMFVDGKLVQRFSSAMSGKSSRFIFTTFGLSRGMHSFGIALVNNGAVPNVQSDCVFIK